MAITASMVKDLREKTGAGMMDCKKALVEANEDFEAAIDWLRAKGLAAAAKKAGRIACEGLTAFAVDGNKGSVIEINSETDFVSRNDKFQDLVREVSQIATHHNNIESLKSATANSGKTVEEEIVANVAKIGENLHLRRMQTLEVSDGVIASYVHNAFADGMGKISVLVALESSGNKKRLMEVGKQIAMHVAAAKPESLNKEGVNPDLIQREKDIFTEQSRASGKPDDIIAKMIEGRIRKFLEEIVLLDQVFVIDGKTRISEVVNNLAKEIGSSVELKAFVRFELGEGIEKEETNFADEVASIAKS
jgi:elongation factor Ts